MQLQWLPSRGKKRKAALAALTVLLLGALLAFSLLLPYAVQRGGVYVDLTEEALYTPSSLFLETMERLKEDVTVTFCAAPDYLLGNTETRAPYILCRKLAKQNPHIKIQQIDLVRDPDAAEAYKTTSVTEIGWSDVIFSAEGKNRVCSARSFWGVEDDELVSFNGEYRVATEAISLTALDGMATVYFAKGHGERYYVEGEEGNDPSLSSLYGLIRDLGLTVKTLELDRVEQVPEDCVLLIFLGTTEDYADTRLYDGEYVSAMDKVDKYLARDRSVFILRDALSPSLPAFDDYFEEWGFRFRSDLVIDTAASLTAENEGERPGTRLVATYPTKDTAAIGYGFLEDIAGLSSPPKTILPSSSSLYMTRKETEVSKSRNNEIRSVSGVFFGSKDAYTVDASGVRGEEGGMWLGAAAAERQLNGNNANEYFLTYVYALGTTEAVTNRYLDDSSMGNRDAFRAALRKITQVNLFVSDTLGGISTYSDTYAGKWIMLGELSETPYKLSDNIEYESITNTGRDASYAGLTTGKKIAWTVVLALLPAVAVPVCGIYVCTRRKNR